jgi:hypothetical protein
MFIVKMIQRMHTSSFLSDTKLTQRLEQKYHDWSYWECSNLDDCMDDIKVWELIPKSRVDRWPTLYGDAKPTSIVVDGEQYYRKAKGRIAGIDQWVADAGADRKQDRIPHGILPIFLSRP